MLPVDYLDKLNLRFKRDAANHGQQKNGESGDSENYDFESNDSDQPQRGKHKRSAATYLERELQRDVKDLNYNLK